jgi:hypothetical protein
MSRIYVANPKSGDASKALFVRSHTLSSAERAIAATLYEVRQATHDEIFEAHKAGRAILDAVKTEEDLDIEDVELDQADKAAEKKGHGKNRRAE